MTTTHGEQAWIGLPVQQLLGERLGRPVVVLNDADAAGVAEIAYGAGKGQAGVVLFPWTSGLALARPSSSTGNSYRTCSSGTSIEGSARQLGPAATAGIWDGLATETR